MKIGYIRVSTEEQHTDRQETIMQKYEVEKVFSEKISGKNTDRPLLKEMLNLFLNTDFLAPMVIAMGVCYIKDPPMVLMCKGNTA